MGLLIANDLSFLEHNQTQLDSHLIDAALLWLNECVSEDQEEDVRVLRDVCTEAVREVRRKRAEAAAMINVEGMCSNSLVSTSSFPSQST